MTKDLEFNFSRYIVHGFTDIDHLIEVKIEKEKVV